jgi:hypothetical protein
MLVKLIERSNGGCYFIAAKFADRACQGTPQLSWCCRYHDWNGLELFCFTRSEGRCAPLLDSGLRLARGENDGNCYVSSGRSVNKSMYARDLRWDLA